ncbi:MAG: SHOCT domain-containing protein [Candidatus Limnocylindria bacterium]
MLRQTTFVLALVVVLVLAPLTFLYAYRAGGPSAQHLTGAVLLSLLPVLLLFAVVMLAARALYRGGAGRRYKLIATLADLRDRGAITEDEFQREKARLLR